MKDIREFWGRGPFTRLMVVLLIAGPLTVACALIAPFLLLNDWISPASYSSFRTVIYWGMGFLVGASFALVAARFNGEV